MLVFPTPHPKGVLSLVVFCEEHALLDESNKKSGLQLEEWYQFLCHLCDLLSQFTYSSTDTSRLIDDCPFLVTPATFGLVKDEASPFRKPHLTPLAFALPVILKTFSTKPSEYIDDTTWTTKVCTERSMVFSLGKLIDDLADNISQTRQNVAEAVVVDVVKQMQRLASQCMVGPLHLTRRQTNSSPSKIS